MLIFRGPYIDIEIKHYMHIIRFYNYFNGYQPSGFRNVEGFVLSSVNSYIYIYIYIYRVIGASDEQSIEEHLVRVVVMKKLSCFACYVLPFLLLFTSSVIRQTPMILVIPDNPPAVLGDDEAAGHGDNNNSGRRWKVPGGDGPRWMQSTVLQATVPPDEEWKWSLFE
ncbi:hypothetical protein JRO89_XS06G0009500 [Xanthoceras sorbifolium]|uniref:Uncharacterized protein n=1 Tax=Xanthoceras sorbifolium TaxID=99658 RepID=A0ABQ8HW23_9ROSI|nr:hypothetical protein JRO89_XS06G0009500 [Xanthoceras sorbifolium]